MATINGVSFRQWLVPTSKYRIKAPYSMVPKKITLHNTDNEMPAHNEISYMRNNNMYVSYHVAIDEKEAIQGVPYNRNAYHAGDGANGYGNRNTIGIEICRNYDRSRKTTNLREPLASQYSKAEQNTIKFVAQLCIDLGIVANNANIKTHNDWDGKWCPSKILNEGRLQQVKNTIIVEYNQLKGTSTPELQSPNQASKAKVDTHLSFSQVVDKTIAGGYGNYPERVASIQSRTNYTYNQVQDEINRRTEGTKTKPVEKKVTGEKVTLPSSASSWRIYPSGGPYTTAHAIGSLSPSKFGGLTYDIVGKPVKDVVQIQTRDYGTVAIYVASSTGAKITGAAQVLPKKLTQAQTLHLPASAQTWRVYNQGGPYTVGNEIHLLTPATYGGLSYEIKGTVAPHTYLIDTGVKGRVAIYAGPGTGATISGVAIKSSPKAAPKSTPKTTSRKKLHLPKTAKTWRVYRPNGPYTSGDEIHLLTPSAFGGITYDILEEKGNHVYIVNTSVKGQVAIYAGPETGAKIT